MVAGTIKAKKLARLCLLTPLGVYRTAVSPFIARRCRFEPSCSEYAGQAISTHGCAKGLCLAAKRLLKCHPFHPGGIDPVPRIYPLRYGRGVADHSAAPPAGHGR